jgi:hypothetical protein
LSSDRPRRRLGDIYGAEIDNDLRAVLRELPADAPEETRWRLLKAIGFINGRLSEAAREGCHHCDEERNGRGAACYWCGLVYSRRRI